MSGIDPTARLCGNCMLFPNCASYATPSTDPRTLHCPSFAMASAADKVARNVEPELPPAPPEVPVDFTAPSAPELPTFDLPPALPMPSEMGGVTVPEPVSPDIPVFGNQQAPTVPDMPVFEDEVPEVAAPENVSHAEITETRNEAFAIYDQIKEGANISEFSDNDLGESIDNLKRARRAEPDKDKKKEFTEAIRFFENELTDRVAKTEETTTQPEEEVPSCEKIELQPAEVCAVEKVLSSNAQSVQIKEVFDTVIRKLLLDLSALETQAAYADPDEILNTVARLVSLRNELQEDR